MFSATMRLKCVGAPALDERSAVEAAEPTGGAVCPPQPVKSRIAKTESAVSDDFMACLQRARFARSETAVLVLHRQAKPLAVHVLHGDVKTLPVLIVP